MKFLSVFLLLTTLSGQVRGQELNLNCFNTSGEQSLTIVEKQESVIEAKLFAYDGQHRAPSLLTTFSGQDSENNNDSVVNLFSKKEYQLSDSEGIEALLTIITCPFIGRGGFGRGGCGRALCEPKISALLNYKQEVTQYECF